MLKNCSLMLTMCVLALDTLNNFHEEQNNEKIYEY